MIRVDFRTLMSVVKLLAADKLRRKGSVPVDLVMSDLHAHTKS